MFATEKKVNKDIKKVQKYDSKIMSFIFLLKVNSPQYYNIIQLYIFIQ
jgi:hypothetical protein